ncbi:DNA mismatch repair protein MutL [Parabacteroides sp. PF5-5]|uniref:DNA mismatch repair endonuclease MutL n=1 Tax=unclassified Parabacteroides TaxID=2649774 RepID=UPI0024750413|nr:MULTISPECIES: DNA mismatch repair endonuclease MutL [unclassified Parabacteroides]MDH6305035.1 DNA mismatch repair protein MutL [Parabacteroides sp. PH5-39]MDH6315880.1 DNA mismatch repair protein MutL [Parabacteroides sp. PF5-13]MDH6319537.1 DNA mismatch repair protein MutL [Parabacteroides sp. PH5-13]MDH6323268.1 DNA mismatch repair protein MutL [Parabacteroides sp. PH5-8]MDH6327224.1 DNA mismatch repair protein MutL [Parabacteroides sp. PH5-41]
MSDIIHLLPDSIANQIAAGEVIQRPASVVKELIENAVDAGATCIQVNIKDAGRTLIQVIDNGKGMSETDARMAFERHATSKINSADDLFALHTMGFRGEALASIAAVAHVELRTRLKGAELGTRILLQGSTVEEAIADSCVEGSIFSVKNLFFNVPARRKFLKSNEAEFRHIIQEFERVALVNHHIELSLYHNDMEIFNLPESGLRQRIVNIFGKAINQKLLSLEAQTSMVTISGFVGTPDSVKKRGALQFFFVNGRFMKHPYFHRAIMQAYEQLIPTGEMPNYFIYFTLDPSAIDVNIHPAKTEIKFEDEQMIWQILMAAVREALAKSNAIPTIDFDKENAIDIPTYNPSENTRPLQIPQVQINPDYNPFKTTSSSYKKEEFDWASLYQGFNKETESANVFPETEIETVSTQDMPETDLFGELSGAYYQYKGRYIVTSLKSGLALIDQYRAHVRILYDQYLQNISQQKGASQKLLFPEIVSFTSDEAAMLPLILDDLYYIGFDLSDLGSNSYAVNGVPAGMESSDPVTLIKDAVSHAIETGCKAHEEICEAIALSLAKAAAIRPGKTLSADEVNHLIASLFSSPSSSYTPDGKPILLILGDDELDKRFK